MKKFEVDWTLNTYGENTLKLFYAGINLSYPELALTETNSTILLIQGYGNPSSPNTAITRIRKGDDPLDTYELLFDRVDINSVLHPPVLTAVDVVAVKALNTSVKVLDYIAKKYNLAFTAKDFWVSDNSIEYTGGTVQPNWLMESRYNSLAWCNKLIVQIH